MHTVLRLSTAAWRTKMSGLPQQLTVFLFGPGLAKKNLLIHAAASRMT